MRHLPLRTTVQALVSKANDVAKAYWGPSMTKAEHHVASPLLSRMPARAHLYSREDVETIAVPPFASQPKTASRSYYQNEYGVFLPISSHQEQGHKDRNHHHKQQGNGHSWKSEAYYTTALFGTLGALLYALLSGKTSTEIEKLKHRRLPPAVASDVCDLPATSEESFVPETVWSQLHRATMAQDRVIKRVVLSGEGGIGKYSTALQAALTLKSEKMEPYHYETVLSVDGSSRAHLEKDLIRVAHDLGMPSTRTTYDSAADFLRMELWKRPGSIWIVRCVRSDTLQKGFPLDDLLYPPHMPWMPISSATILMTTGSADVIKAATERSIPHVSLTKSLSAQDIVTFSAHHPAFHKQCTERESMATLYWLATDVFQKNPSLARLGLIYLRQHPEQSILKYGERILEGPDTAPNIMRTSLEAIESNGGKHARTILGMIAPKQAPQQGISIDALHHIFAKQVFGSDHITHESRREVFNALQQLERYGLVNYDSAHNHVYPHFLLRQTPYLHQSPQEEATPPPKTAWQQRVAEKSTASSFQSIHP